MKLEKKHYWMIGIGLTVLTVGTILYVRNKKKKREEEEANQNKPRIDGGAQQFVGEEAEIVEERKEEGTVLKRDENTGNLFPLLYGAENDSVASLQKYINSTCPSELKKAGVFPLIIDGVWGDKTETAALACSALKRNKIDRETFERISRDLLSANIS
jgi:hypothetical protein